MPNPITNEEVLEAVKGALEKLKAPVSDTTPTTDSTTPTQPTQVSIPWYASRTFAAMVQTTVLTSLGWLSIALATNKWDDWQIALLLPVVSNLFIIFRDMWSTSIIAPANFMNANNAPAKILQAGK